MNKKAIWWIVGVVVVILIIVFAMMGIGGGTGSPADTSSSTASGNSVQSANSQAGAAMSLKDIFSAGASQQCAFSTNTESGSSGGTVYVTAGHMRGDFTANTSQGAIVSHMITDGQTAYVWTDNQAQGIKMSFVDMDTSASKPAGAPASSDNAPNPDAKTNYSCGNWAVDGSKFNLPSGVAFADMSAMMGGTGAGASAGAGAGASNQCSMCNQIPDATQKEQCLAALHC